MNKFIEDLIKNRNMSSLDEFQSNLFKSLSVYEKRLDSIEIGIRRLSLDIFLCECTSVNIPYMLEKCESLKEKLRKAKFLKNRIFSLKRFISINLDDVTEADLLEISFLDGNEDERYL